MVHKRIFKKSLRLAFCMALLLSNTTKASEQGDTGKNDFVRMEFHSNHYNHGLSMNKQQATMDSGMQADTAKFTMQCGGMERSYRLHIPSNLPENASLVVVLHGYNRPNDHGRFNKAADRHKFAVCYPLGEKDPKGKPGWNVGYPSQRGMTVDDVEFLTQLVHHLQDKYGFSRHNVFCTGMSNGGDMCYQLAAQSPNLFAAVASIAGLMFHWLYKSDNSASAVPIFEIHGTNDKVSKWEGDPENIGGWGAYLSVPLAINYWVAKNRCTVVHSDTIKGKAPNYRKIVKHRFSGGKEGSEVWLNEIIGGGHTWAFEDMDTDEEVWRFFCRFMKP